jgi:hypothetical protein
VLVRRKCCITLPLLPRVFRSHTRAARRKRRRNATSLYCIPYFHIIGVSKCGTTDMFRRLSLHPQVAPTHNKGPHFWDERHTVDWYLKLYEVAVPVIEKCAPLRARWRWPTLRFHAALMLRYAHSSGPCALC